MLKGNILAKGGKEELPSPHSLASGRRREKGLFTTRGAKIEEEEIKPQQRMRIKRKGSSSASLSAKKKKKKSVSLGKRKRGGAGS